MFIISQSSWCKGGYRTFAEAVMGAKKELPTLPSSGYCISEVVAVVKPKIVENWEFESHEYEKQYKLIKDG